MPKSDTNVLAEVRQAIAEVRALAIEFGITNKMVNQALTRIEESVAKLAMSKENDITGLRADLKAFIEAQNGRWLSLSFKANAVLAGLVMTLIAVIYGLVVKS